MTPRRCTTPKDSMVHASLNAVGPPDTKIVVLGETACGQPHIVQILRADRNTDPVTCTRCIAALTRLGDAIDACLEGRSG